jgi:hypothetical protein
MKKKAIFFTLWLYTFLIWLYVVARIIFDYVSPNDPFVYSVPYFTFAELGAISFVVSMIFMYFYLTTK